MTAKRSGLEMVAGLSRRSARKGLVTEAFRLRSPRQGCNAASVLANLATNRFVLPLGCLHPPLSEHGVEEAPHGESYTSLQRSPMFWTEAGQVGTYKCYLTSPSIPKG